MHKPSRLHSLILHDRAPPGNLILLKMGRKQNNGAGPLCAGMHFQDRHNYDVERVKRCVILYSTPAGVFPFCTYNGGPEYRPMVERAYAESG